MRTHIFGIKYRLYHITTGDYDRANRVGNRLITIDPTAHLPCRLSSCDCSGDWVLGGLVLSMHSFYTTYQSYLITLPLLLEECGPLI